MMRVWAKDEPFGAELADVSLGDGSLSAAGFAIGMDPSPYRLGYQLTTIDGYVTAQLRVQTMGEGWRRDLVLERDASGAWSCSTESEGHLDSPPPGGNVSALADALDCDLGLSPLTNAMPVLRHGLHKSGGSPLEFLMAWVSVPDLAVYPSRQRYTFVRAGVVRYESVGTDFAADITFDEYGLVVDYPGIGRLAR